MDAGITSIFRFESYKVDIFRFNMKPNVDILKSLKGIEPHRWNFSIGIREPLYYKKDKFYLGGLNYGLFVFPEGLEENEKKPEKTLITLESGMAGVFSVEKPFDPEIEDQFVRIQIPALLFPFLRGTITSFLANSGFGSVILPIVNMNKLSEEALKNTKVKVIE